MDAQLLNLSIAGFCVHNPERWSIIYNLTSRNHDCFHKQCLVRSGWGLPVLKKQAIEHHVHLVVLVIPLWIAALLINWLCCRLIMNYADFGLWSRLVIDGNIDLAESWISRFCGSPKNRCVSRCVDQIQLKLHGSVGDIYRLRLDYSNGAELHRHQASSSKRPSRQKSQDFYRDSMISVEKDVFQLDAWYLCSSAPLE